MKKLISKLLVLTFVVSLMVVVQSPLQVKADTGDFQSLTIISASQSVFQHGGSKTIRFTISNPMYELPKALILNSKGTLVSTLIANGSSFVTCSWDGKDSKKKYVSDGIYKFKITSGKLSKFYSFKVKKKPTGSDLIGTKFGFLNLYGMTAKIPFNWIVDYDYGSVGRNYLIYSPLSNGKQGQIAFTYKNYSSTDFTSAFIKEETIKTSDSAVVNQYSGSIIGTYETTLGGYSATNKLYEYHSYNLTGELSYDSFDAAVSEYFVSRGKIIFDIVCSNKKGYTGNASIFKTVLSSVKFTSVDSEVSDEFADVEIQSTGNVASAPFSFDLPAGICTMTYEDYYSGDSILYIVYGNPIFNDSRFSAKFETFDTGSESFETMISQRKDSLRGLPFTTPKMEDVIIDGVSMKKISVIYQNERYKWADIREFYMFERNSNVYSFTVKILAENAGYDKQVVTDMIAKKDAIISSLKIAK